MPYLANITIMGHAGSDAQSRQVGDQTVTRINVAVETRKKVDGAWAKHTTWWQVEVWGKQAEWLAADGKKGALVIASGEPSLDEYTGKDGTQQKSLRIRATEARVVRAKGEAGASTAPAAAAPATQATGDEAEPPF
jgi:single stranded DNA-binding protein